MAVVGIGALVYEAFNKLRKSVKGRALLRYRAVKMLFSETITDRCSLSERA